MGPFRQYSWQKWRWRLQLPRRNYTGVICLVLAVSLFAGGAISMLQGLQQQKQLAQTQNLGELSTDQKPSKPALQQGYFMPYAEPTTLSVPSVGINTSLVTVGKTSSGAIDAPRAPNFDKAAWYKDSAAPGQYGTSVVVGHVDSFNSETGESVFYNLAKVKLGETVAIQRSDNSTATFRIYATRQYDRAKLPSAEVYGAPSSYAELRLITCSGAFDTSTQNYTDNTVIFATLIRP